MLIELRTIRLLGNAGQGTALEGLQQRLRKVQQLAQRTQELMSRVFLTTALVATLLASGQSVYAAAGNQPRFKQIPTQYIAALGDPGASAGSGAQAWGLWPLDPGPRGVRLSNYDELQNGDGTAPAGWKLDGADWWLEEHGLIMEPPEFPLPAGKYLVTGDREVTAVLTVHPADLNGDMRWELAKGATLYDVTHLACRSARYTPLTGAGSCSPTKAQQSAFPVTPGAAMPAVEGCAQQDYAVLIVTGVAETD